MYICIYVFTQERIYVKLYRRMYVYTYVCIYVFMYIHNAAFTQGNMYGMVIWLYVYTYGVRIAYHKPTDLSSNLRRKTFSKNVWAKMSCLK